MRIIVSDSSCLIDLLKGGLLEAFLGLPYELVIPDVLLESDLLSFGKRDPTLLRHRVTVAKLSGDGVARVSSIISDWPTLSFFDGFAFVVAEERPGCILLTSNDRLRERAQATEMECRGVLWVVDEVLDAGLATKKMVQRAKEIWRDDGLTRSRSTSLGRTIVQGRG